ncbi:MAG: DUF1349 domain-containing protein [Planctomycetes bacterium]|nr:DUF1349 domain-containing protein [Planctomycetota bacterium]
MRKIIALLAVIVALPQAFAADQNLGIFEQSTDIGQINQQSKVSYDAEKQQYTITTAGENVWNDTDAFHFVYKTISGDFTLTADVMLIGDGVNPHRKAGLMVRQSLEHNSAYADAIVHGDGLICLQYRSSVGQMTEDECQNIPKPTEPVKIKLSRQGNTFTYHIIEKDNTLKLIATKQVALQNPAHVGLMVCSHEKDVQETAVFSNVKITSPKKGAENMSGPILESTLETINIETGKRKIIYQAKEHFEAPNWSRDGKSLIFNQGGKIYTIDVNGGKPQLIDTGFATHCNNDHGLSPDGKQFVVSHHTEKGSQIFILPSKGGEPKLVTELAPSYWHGWSPDGKTLAYCAERNGQYDIYTIPVEGGKETRLTDAPGLDDGPDYSPDGKYIYINSERTGLMKIWRIDADGKNQTQITTDPDYADWFAHPSPDGKWIIFVSFDKSVKGHPANKDVALRLMPVDGGKPKIIAELFGGQGTINVPSWSPDSKYAAFVSYRLIEQ